MEIFSYENTNTDPGKPGRPLSGRRVVVQPNMSKRGWPCDAGSRALENYIALEDSTVLARLCDAGGSLAGSSRMSELGLGLEGDTTVQAIVEKKADIALITDTMGEVRVAAAGACLFGFKPSWGVVSRAGLIGLVPSMECWGVASGDLNDIALIMKTVAGRDGLDFSLPDEDLPDFSVKAATGGCRVGVVSEMTDLLSEEERARFDGELALLKDAGLEITKVAFPEFGLFRMVHQVIAAAEASSSAGKYDGVRYGHRSEGSKNWNDMYLDSRGEAFGTFVKRYLFQGAYFQFENYAAFEDACRVRRRLVQGMEELFRRVDILVSPVRRASVKSSDIKELYDSFELTLPANVTGQPALQAPGTASAEKSMSLQFMAPRLQDARLLALGERLRIAKEGA